MVDIEDGSVVWARSHHKEKFWPSVIFRTWEAAKQAGFVLDGIAFLIEAGRKIDVTDDEASPREGEVLNLYLGENPEWQFVPEDESYILPFMQHREKMRKQRLGGQLKHQFAPALATADRMCGASGQEPSTPGSSSGGGGGGGGGGSSAARPSVANPSPKQRTGVLLDFGTGTSFASFAELWHYLLHNGWATVPGKGLASWYYYPPGSDPKMRNPVLNRNFFDSEDAVIDHVRRTGLERPAPVRTVIPRSNSAAKAKTGTPKSRVSDARPPFAGSPVPAPSISPDGTTPRASKPSAAASGTAATAAAAAAAATPSTAAAAAAAVAAANTVATPPSPRSPEPMSSRDLVVSAVNSHANSNNKGSSSKTVDNSSSGSSKRVNSSKCKGGGSSSKRNKGTATPLRLDGKGGGGGKGASTAPVGFPATSVGLLPGFSGVSGGKKAIVGGYSGVGGGGDWDETRDVSSDDLEFVDIGEEDVRLTLETEGIRGGGDGDGKGCDAAVEAVSVAKTQRGAQERTGWPTASRVSIASRRSHGRSMQVEATHVSSSGRGAAPNLAEAVMRQAVTARRLASSPPAPSPSKRPKRAGPQLPPRELARLADKQLAHLRGLLSGAEEPYPTHCGLEGPVSELVRFVTKAYAAWKGRRAGSRASSQAVAESRARGVGAIVLAGPGGTGKSTAFQAAAREFSKRASVKASTIRFVTIKCDRLGGGSGGGGGDPNEVFAKVLAAVTGKATKMTGDNALEALERLTEPSPFLVVFCLEDGGNSLDPSVLQRLLDMAYRQEILFALVCMGTSIDRGMEIRFEQGNLGRHCPMVPMMPCAEDRLRAILGQTLGASGAQDKDGEMIATLVNKGALDVIAKTVARVCGSVRIALNVCEVALVDRLRELGQDDSTTSQAGTSSPATAASACWASSLHGGGSGGAAMCSESASPKGSGGGAAGVLLTVAGAKAALNSYLQTHLVMSAGAVAVEAGGGGGVAVSQPGDGATG